MAHKNGLNPYPSSVAEFGPGDSLGIGLAALLTGGDRYYAFDVVKYVSLEKNIAILEELIGLYKNRERIPDDGEFPNIRPCLASYEFPHEVLPDEYLDAVLDPNRTKPIREALLNPNCGNGKIQISYIANWDARHIGKNSINMIFSQAVLEHVDDLENMYSNFYLFLKPGGFMSHQIDFRCHRTATKWNGHWAYSNVLWKLIRGKRPFLINRKPCSTHINLLEINNFQLVDLVKTRGASGIKRGQLSQEFRNMSDDDLTTCDAFIQSIKKA